MNEHGNGMYGQGPGQAGSGRWDAGQGQGAMGQGGPSQPSMLGGPYPGAMGQDAPAMSQGQGPVGMGQPGMGYAPFPMPPGAPHAPFQSPPGMAPWPGHGYAVPPMPAFGYAPPPMPGYPHGMGHGPAPAARSSPGMAQVMQEIASGGSGLSSLTKLLDFDDTDFWKGALVGAAAVLLLTNESVQNALFRGAVKGRDAAKEGVEKVKESVDNLKQQARTVKEKGDE